MLFLNRKYTHRPVKYGKDTPSLAIGPFTRYDILYYHDKCWYIYSFQGTDEALLQSCLSTFVRQED